MVKLSRRGLLSGAAWCALVSAVPALAREYNGGIPWKPSQALPPERYDPRLRFFTADERTFVTAAVDRLIPKDEFPSASELGVVDFLDFQLAGSYGRGDIFYLHPPFQSGSEEQGYQSREPAWLYRTAIAEIEATLRAGGRPRFAQLPPEDQDRVLTELDEGQANLANCDGKTFFDLLLQNTIEGTFGDPVYGGNRDMAAWRMIGFPGARYDYRPYVDRHNVALEFQPVSVAGFSRASILPDGR